MDVTRLLGFVAAGGVRRGPLVAREARGRGRGDDRAHVLLASYAHRVCLQRQARGGGRRGGRRGRLAPELHGGVDGVVPQVVGEAEVCTVPACPGRASDQQRAGIKSSVCACA